MSSRRAPVKSHLERLITSHARSEGIAPDRVRRWVSTMVLLGALDRDAPAGQPRFLLKGGVAIELRLRAGARATKDVDLVFRGEPRDLLQAVDDALAVPFAQFTFTRTPPAALGPHAQRVDVQLAYQSRAWATVRTEFSHAEAGHDEHELVPAIDLDAFWLDGPAEIACLPLRWQIAQKLHALTTPAIDGRENTRFRDLADLLLLAALIDDHRALRDACETTFAIRALHPWPPRVEIPPAWHEPFAALATSLDLATTDAHAAADEIHRLIRQIAAA